MPTRGSLAVEVAKAHMEEQMKWSVQRIMKTCLCKGTAVYMVWTTDDHKSHPHTNFVGNVRIATWHSAGVGVTTFIFKDSTIRHVRAADIGKIIEVSNNILSSSTKVHVAAKFAAQQEPVCVPLESQGTDAAGEQNEEGDEDENENGDEEENEDDNEEGDENEDGDENEEGDKHDENVVTTGALAPQINTNGSPSSSVASEGLASVHVAPKTPLANGEKTSDAVTTTTLGAAGVESTSVQVGSVGTFSKAGNFTPTTPPSSTEVEKSSDSLVNPPPAASSTAMEETMESQRQPPPPPAYTNTEETPTFNGMVDPGTQLPTTIRELRAMEALVKAKKKIIRSMQKKAADPHDKKAVAKQLAAQLKAMKTEVKMEKEQAKKMEKEQAKKNVPVLPLPKRPRCDDADDDEDGDNDDVIDDFTRPEKRVLNTIDKWQKGHRRAALLAAQNKVVESVTVDTWAEAHANMCVHGWAVVNNFVDLLHPACRPDADMRDYILDCTFAIHACLCVVFFCDVA